MVRSWEYKPWEPWSCDKHKKLRCKMKRLIGKAKVYGKRIGLYVVLSAEAERVVPVKPRSWWTLKRENRLMAVVECMEAYQREQKDRKAKIRVGKPHVAGCLLIGQESGNFFPNMRVRHGVHMRSFTFLNNA